MLEEDQTTGRISNVGTKAVVLDFHDKVKSKSEDIFVVREPGVIQGELFQVGGKDETINIQLMGLDRKTIYRAVVSRSLASDLINSYMWKNVRIHGDATWKRDDDGWSLTKFHGTYFEPVGRRDLRAVASEIHQMGRDGLWLVDDPIRELELNRKQ